MTSIAEPPTRPAVMGGLWFAFFLLGMSPGFYIPALTNIIEAKQLGSVWVERAFLAAPVAAIISPLMVGALADNRFAGQKLYGWIGMVSALLMAAAFYVLDRGMNPWGFIGLLGLSAIIAAPMWSMLTSLAMAHLVSGERDFPLVRVGGTIGWIAAGVATSYVLGADDSPNAGYAGAATRFLCGLTAFWLPHTPPVGNSRSWRTLMGLDAFRLLKERDHFIFFLVTAILSVPLMAFYMHAPKHLRDLGSQESSALMTVGQISEIVAMLIMAAAIRRYRVKSLLLVALGLSALRYGIFSAAGAWHSTTWMVAGIALHGISYTFYFITGQLFLDRRVERGMRTQAQGLLSLMSNGVGSIAGTMMARWLYDRTITGGSGGWKAYWAVQTGMILICLPLMIFCYRGVAASKAGEDQGRPQEAR